MPTSIKAADVPPKTKASSYPEPSFSFTKGREKRPHGDFFGLKSIGVTHSARAGRSVGTFSPTQ
jgi:uncharacterized cupin superfamily protein